MRTRLQTRDLSLKLEVDFQEVTTFLKLYKEFCAFFRR